MNMVPGTLSWVPPEKPSPANGSEGGADEFFAITQDGERIDPDEDQIMQCSDAVVLTKDATL